MGTTSQKLTYLNETKQLLKDKINNLGGSIDDNTTFRNYANQLQNVYDNYPKTSFQTGTEVNLGKTIKGKLDFENGVVGIGQDEQDSTKGYQLFDISKVSSSESQYIYNNGFKLTKGVNRTLIINLPNTIPAGTYTISEDIINSTLSDNNKVMINFRDENLQTVLGNWEFLVNGTFTLTAPVKSLYFFIGSSETDGVTITLDNIMLNSGSTAKDFEKYTGGIPSPNPNYKEDIKCVTGNQDVVVQNKNLCTEMEQGDVSTSTGEASSYQPTTSGFIRSKDYIPVKPSEVITVSYKNTATSSIQIVIFEYNANKTYIGFYYSNASTYTRTLGNETAYIKIRLQDTTNTLSNNTEIQVEYGNTKTSYVEHQEHSYQLSLGDIELNAIGNYADELIYDVDEDKVYKNEKIKKVIINSSYRTSGGTTGTDAYYIATSLSDGLNDNSNILAYSNMFKGISFDNRSGAPDSVMLQSGSVTLRTRNNTDIDWSDNTKRDAWLNANTPLVYYVLATPTLTEITDQTLHAQVKALYNAHSLNGTTIITSNGNLPMIIKVRALKGE